MNDERIEEATRSAYERMGLSRKLERSERDDNRAVRQLERSKDYKEIRDAVAGIWNGLLP